MEKTVLIKVIGALLGVAAAVTGVVVAVRHFTKAEDAYRSILIYEMEGTANIEREGTGTIGAAENLYLESGDQLTTAADSSVRLKLDDDKYIMVEEDTVLSIEAVGTKEDSKTKIQLVQGAITNEIQNALSAESVYEVTTPNSVMAVRGTIFRVEVYFDEKGEAYAKLSVFDGKVGSVLILPDGTMENEVTVEDGNEVIIHSNTDLTEYLTGPADIVFEELSMQSLYTLYDLVGADVSITGTNKEELEILIWGEKKEAAENPKGTPTAAPEATKKPEEKGNSATPSVSPKKENDKSRSGMQPTATPAVAASQPTVIPQPTETPKPVAVVPPSSDQEETGDSGSEDPPAENQPAESQTSFTVQFLYQGQLFGTQTVEKGQTASCPKLNPAASGSWNFDFSTAIHQDTTVEWVE